MKQDIPGYEGLYAADENGVIWSLVTTTSRRKGPLKPYVNTGGYLRVNLFNHAGEVRHEYVHRLVAKTFLPNPSKFRIVNHKDANPANNAVSNLEWCSQKYNIAESRKLGKQGKDKPVIAFSLKTGEMRKFPCIKAAAVDLFGRYDSLWYHHRKKGNIFEWGSWKFEVMTNGRI